MDATYSAARLACIELDTVASPAVTTFVLTLRRLYRDVGPDRNHEFWRPLWKTLYDAQTYILGSPLPPESWSHIHDVDFDHLETSVQRVGALFAGEEKLLQETIASLRQILDLGTDLPAISVITEHASNGAFALLLSSPFLVRDTRARFSTHPDLAKSPVLTISALRNSHVELPLVVLGPPAYFPDWVFAAPRARLIRLVTYNCVNFEIEFRPSFDFMESRFHQRFPQVVHRVLAGPDTSETEKLDARDLILPAESYLPAVTSHREGDEEVDSVLLILEDDLGIWIEREGRPLAIIVDDEIYVRRVPAFQLEPGMFLLVRLDDDDDYIAEVANSILGDQAEPLRTLQGAWKIVLRGKVSTSDVLSVSIALLDLGSQIANETNLRNWMSPRSIRTQRRVDFDAIMQFIGWTERAEQVWSAMEEIDRAHRKAGRLVRRQLLEQVERLDPALLESRGRMEFSVPGVGGNLTALRINQISPSIAAVPLSELGKPFELKVSAA